jgi:hypothetical protein
MLFSIRTSLILFASDFTQQRAWMSSERASLNRARTVRQAQSIGASAVDADT